MNRFLSPQHAFRLLAIALGLGSTAHVLAQPLPFAGRWLPDPHPEAKTPHAVLTIDDTSMSWRGQDKSAPRCVQPFVLKTERPGTVYADGHGTKFVAGAAGSLPTYLLKLGAGNCGRIADDLRISFPLVYDINHIEIIGYVQGKPVSVRRFRRKK